MIAAVVDTLMRELCDPRLVMVGWIVSADRSVGLWFQSMTSLHRDYYSLGFGSSGRDTRVGC